MDNQHKKNVQKNPVSLVTEGEERYNIRSTEKNTRAKTKESVQKQMEALAQQVATKTATELLR